MIELERFYNSERDLEERLLLDFVEARRDSIRSVLDVGAHYSWYTYAAKLRPLVQVYNAVDLIPDEKTAAIVDRYLVGNVCEIPFAGGADLVFSISSIEHSGISTYRHEDWHAERLRVFKRLHELTSRYLFVTFPFGADMFLEGEYANVTATDLQAFEAAAPGLESRFFFCERVQEPFREIGRHEAAQIAYKPEAGLRCVGVVSLS